MDALWVLLITSALILVHVLVLVRAAVRGRQWAIDALRGMAWTVEGPTAASVWCVQDGERHAVAADHRGRTQTDEATSHRVDPTVDRRQA